MFCNNCGNKLDKDSKFCNNCGNKIDYQISPSNIQGFNQTSIISNSYVKNQMIPPYSQTESQKQTSKHSNKRTILAGTMIGTFLLTIIILVTFIINNQHNNYYFSSEQNKPDKEIYETPTSSNQKGKYKTIIVYDNVYSGVKISNDKDAFDLIKQDSVSQKNSCPSEIKKVEEEFINKFGITAVNLCEMDVEFAKELEKVFQKIYDEYPSVRGYITNFTLVNTNLKDDYIAAFMPVFQFATSNSSSTYPWVIKTQILLNTSYFLNKDRLQSSVNSASNSGHFPKNSSIYSPVAHELGHYLSFLAMMKHYELNSILLVKENNINNFGEGNYSLSMLQEAYDNYKKDTNNRDC